MAVTIHRFPRPWLKPTLKAGGDLSTTTTYFFTGFYQRNGGYYGNAVSPAAYEVSSTPTAGERTINMEWFKEGGYITAFADAGGGYVTVTSADHGLSENDTVDIWGTTNYNTDGSTATSVATDTFEIQATWNGDDATGTWGHDSGIPTYANGIILKWDNYSMLDSGDGNFYQWLNLNDPTHSGKGEFDEGYGHRKWTHRYYHNGFSGTNVDLTDSNLYDGAGGDSSTYRGAGMIHPEIAWRKTSYPISTEFSELKGKICIQCDDTSDFDDIKTALIADGESGLYNVNKNSFVVLGMMAGNSTADIEEKQLTFIGGYHYCDSLTFKNSAIFNERMSSSFWGRAYGAYEDSSHHHFGNAFTQDQCNSATNYNPYAKNTSLTFYGAAEGFNIVGSSFVQYRYFNAAQTFDTMYFKDTYVYATAASGTPTDTMTWTDVEFENEGERARDIFIHYGYMDDKFCNYTFNCTNVFCDRTDGKIRMEHSGTGDPKELLCIWNFYFPISLTVKDEFNTALSDVSVSLIWDTGSDTGFTDSSGQSTVTALSYTVEYDSGDADGYGYNTDTSDFKTLTLRLIKSGYETYETQTQVSSGQEWEITLYKTPYKNRIGR